MNNDENLNCVKNTKKCVYFCVALRLNILKSIPTKSPSYHANVYLYDELLNFIILKYSRKPATVTRGSVQSLLLYVYLNSYLLFIFSMYEFIICLSSYINVIFFFL